MKIDEDRRPKIPPTIKNDRPKLNHDMKNGLGSDVRKGMANESVARDAAAANRDRASKYVEKSGPDQVKSNDLKQAFTPESAKGAAKAQFNERAKGIER